MSFELQRALEGKRAFRRKLAARPVAEKLRLLDEMRARDLTLRRSREISPAVRPNAPKSDMGASSA